MLMYRRYVACEENHTAVVRLLVERKANVNLVGGYSFRPINIAAWHGNEEVVRLLLENGAEIDPEQPEYWYGSALGAACRRGHVEVVKLLLSKGWSPTRAMKTYGSFLACAAAYGHLEVVEILLENEARITVLEQALVAVSNYRSIRRSCKIETMHLLTFHLYRLRKAARHR